MRGKYTYNDNEASDKLPEALRINPFTVPNGYFESLLFRTSQQCRSSENIPVTFSIPTGYFESLEDRITAKIAEEKVRAFADGTGFSVPEEYFPNLEAQLLIHHKVASTIAGTGYIVPANYFETSQQDILNKTVQQEITPIRNINVHRPWKIYVAAACVAVVLSVAGVLKMTTDNSVTKSSLASVSDQEILNYLEIYGATDDMMYISEHLEDFDERGIGQGVSEEDIEAYLNHTL